MKSYRKVLSALIICGFLLSACGKENEILLFNEETVVSADRVEDQTSTVIDDQAGNRTTIPDAIPETYYYIHICGAIVYPGVYEVVEGTRLYEVIDLAGGFTTNACENYSNQALQVEDGQQIYIPTELEVENDNFSEKDNINSDISSTSISDGLVNINTALAEELCSLPGIGASRAQDIITYREQNGDFIKIEDIQKVTGIKEGLFSKIKNLITV